MWVYPIDMPPDSEIMICAYLFVYGNDRPFNFSYFEQWRKIKNADPALHWAPFQGVHNCSKNRLISVSERKELKLEMHFFVSVALGLRQSDLLNYRFSSVF